MRSAVVAVLFVLAVAAVVRFLDDSVQGALILLGLVAGLVIGRWWALALAAAVPLVAPLAPSSGDAGSPVAFTALFFGPLVLAAIALGVWLHRRFSDPSGVLQRRR
jgi:predicted membrane protein